MYENLHQVRAAMLLHVIVSSVNVHRRSVAKAPLSMRVTSMLNGCTY